MRNPSKTRSEASLLNAIVPALSRQITGQVLTMSSIQNYLDIWPKAVSLALLNCIYL